MFACNNFTSLKYWIWLGTTKADYKRKKEVVKGQGWNVQPNHKWFSCLPVMQIAPDYLHPLKAHTVTVKSLSNCSTLLLMQRFHSKIKKKKSKVRKLHVLFPCSSFWYDTNICALSTASSSDSSAIWNIILCITTLWTFHNIKCINKPVNKRYTNGSWKLLLFKRNETHVAVLS